MPDAILVLNAGSSSIKFSVFVAQNGDLEPAFNGQVEALFTSPHFIAKTPDGAILGEKSWGEGVKLGHHGAIEHLRAFLREHRGGMKLAGLGHRVVLGGGKYLQPVRVNSEIVPEL